MKKPEYKCCCDQMLDIPKEKIILHLQGCPEQYYYQEYYAMPWYKRWFVYRSPKVMYREKMRLFIS